jgi:amino acid adenylation domain-containing protein
MNEKAFPLSKVQETFWVLNSIYPENTAYHIPSLFLIEGPIDTNTLEKAVNHLFDRHQVLRAYFSKNAPVSQSFVEPQQVSIKIAEKNLDLDWNANKLPDEVLTNIHAPFDLSEPPLFRVNLYQFSDKKSLLIFVFHHIIIDLYSKTIFGRELSLLYNAFVKGQPVPELDPALDFADHLTRYENWSSTIEGQQMMKDWKQNLPNAERILELPTDRQRPAELDLNGSRIFFELKNDYFAGIKNLARANSLNAFTILLSAYAIFLRKFTGQEQITIGVPFTNRRNEKDQSTFGCYVNILPLEIDFSANPTGVELLRQIRLAMLHTHRRQEISFVELVQLTQSKGQTNHNAFFQAGFTFEPPMELTLDGVKTLSLPFERKGAQLDIFMTLWENNESFCGYWEYAESLLEKDTVVKWIDNFKETIGQFISNPNANVDEYNILTQKEIDDIDSWNATSAPYERSKCIHQKFEEQAQSTPNQIALYHEKGNFTYKEFNEKANALARLLADKKVVPGSVVAICAERSPELMIAILATLKAGAAYLPLGIDYPAERIKSIIADATPVVLLSTKTSKANLKELPVGTLFLDELALEPIAQNPSVAINSSHLAYILYTSGSTGTPKGVMIEHHSVLNRIGWMQKAYPISSKDILIQKTPVTFDVSVWELFWWFWEGAGLVLLPPGGEKDPEVIINHIFTHQVTTIHFVPSMFQSFVSYLKAFGHQDKILSLRNIFLSGEALPEKLVNDFYGLFSAQSPTLVNLYGPTEATVDVSHYVCQPEKPVYIGKPIDNTGLFVIGSNQKIKPVGVPGELIITGVNLSRGYLNRPALNSEKFITFDYKDNTLRAYRTGDLCRWTKDGNIEYLGRIDHQVKLRGFRIELGEIENVMLEHPQIASAAVLLNQQNPQNPHLVGFYTLKNIFYELSTEDIKDFLRKKLPDYMIPAFFVLMETMPLTSSGKLDRKQLCMPEPVTDTEEAEDYTPLENKVANVWRQVLKKENINPNRNFFDLGGNSLLAIQVISQLKTEMNININVLAMMQHPTLRSFANYLSSIKN